MLKPENITVDVLFAKFHAEDLYHYMKDHRIITIQDLIDEMEKHSVPDQHYAKREIETLNKKIHKFNWDGKKEQVYKIKEYSDPSLKEVDEKNLGKVLMIEYPSTAFTAKYAEVKRWKISDIKQNLVLCYGTGMNALTRNCHNLSPKCADNVAEKVDMYTEQVERQAKLTDDRSGNLFLFQKEEKEKLAREKYAEIIAFFLHLDEDFVWGDLTEGQKRAFLSSVINGTEKDFLIRDKLIRYISDYTTLEELERVAYHHDYNVLKRFVKKR